MEDQALKKCSYCAELIKMEAIKCRYCGSMLNRRQIGLDALSTPGYWHRVEKGKKVAGVCTGMAYQLDAPILILPLRLFFILTTVFYGFGVLLYIVLWILMPPPTSGQGDGSDAEHAQELKAPEEPAEEEGTGRSPEDGEERRTKVSRFSVSGILVISGMLILIPLYGVVLEHLLDIHLSRPILAFGLASTCCCLLAGMVVALYHRRAPHLLSREITRHGICRPSQVPST